MPSGTFLRINYVQFLPVGSRSSPGAPGIQTSVLLAGRGHQQKPVHNGFNCLPQAFSGYGDTVRCWCQVFSRSQAFLNQYLWQNIYHRRKGGRGGPLNANIRVRRTPSSLEILKIWPNVRPQKSLYFVIRFLVYYLLFQWFCF
ncbi:hypothetical protein NPIL_113991 [Nephila pilipes]|uniref:Uncharacterized protein n=1 Tax=Nephila pilipes TaxID=299642 RepID=A0A8X6UJG6_NEPPI|nr:hypothetical protein NPIL_113991 [Nephila pilipes]